MNPQYSRVFQFSETDQCQCPHSLPLKEVWKEFRFKFRIFTNLPWGVIEQLYWQ